jgi:hypothetical protein
MSTPGRLPPRLGGLFQWRVPSTAVGYAISIARVEDPHLDRRPIEHLSTLSTVTK